MNNKKYPSLRELFQTIPTHNKRGFWRKLLAYSGPGYFVAVGYMDPGNWATDLEGGASFGYALLSVILISNLMAILLQHLALKLGIVTGRDLAQSCRDRYSRTVSFILWILCEIAIIATDLAEILGSAIALYLLFDIPILWGSIITVIDVLLILYLQNKGLRYLESVIIGLIIVIGVSFTWELILAKPLIGEVLAGLIPTSNIVIDPKMLYISIGILGATVMPHNIYLHSSIILSRNWGKGNEAKKEAIKFSTIDSTFALSIAFLINGAILVLSAAVFYNTQYSDVAEIQQAYLLLSPLLGVPIASILFGVALLASGQNSTITGTIAGQIVLEGFLDIRLPPWQRRLITRLIALGPVIITLIIFGDQSITSLLVLSQVVLSMQLPFAVIPLIFMTNDKKLMGQFANNRYIKILAIFISVIIIIFNVILIYQVFSGRL